MKYYITLFIVAILAVFFILIPNNYLSKMNGKKIDKSIKEYKDNVKMGEEVFKDNFSKGYPKTIEGFDFKKLNALGKKIDLDFSNVVKKIKKPYGSYWISSALSMSVMKTLKNMTTTLLNLRISTFKLINILIVITLILFILLFFITKNQIDETGKKSTAISIIIGSATILGLIAFFITDSSAFINLIKNPINCLCLSNNTASIFVYRFLVMALEIIFALYISIKLIFGSSKNSKYAFFWITPMAVLIMSLFTLTVENNGLDSTIKTQNWYYMQSSTTQTASDAIFKIRQWAKSNDYKDFSTFSAKTLSIPQKTEYATYNIQTDGSKITILSTMLHKNKYNQSPQFKATYDIQDDSIDRKQIQK